MAISATLTVFNAPNGIDGTQNRRILHGLLAFAAGTYAAGGVLPSYAPLYDVSGESVLVDSLTVAPARMILTSLSGSGYLYFYNNSTGKVQIFESSAAAGPLAELPNGALPAGVLGDTIGFVAEWIRA